MMLVACYLRHNLAVVIVIKTYEDCDSNKIRLNLIGA